MVDFGLMGLVFPFLAFSMSLTVLLHDPRRLQNLAFFNTGLSASIFTASIFLGFRGSVSPEAAVMLNRTAVAFTLNTASSLLFFSLVFPSPSLSRPLLAWVGINAVSLGISTAAMVTDLFVVSIQVSQGNLGMERVVGPLYSSLYLPAFASFILGSALVFFRKFRSSPYQLERRQILYTGVATVGGGLMAALTCMILPQMGINNVYVFGPAVGVVLFVGIMVYNITNFKAMDVEVLVARITLWGTSAVLATLPIAGITYILINNSAELGFAGGMMATLAAFLAVYMYLKVGAPFLKDRFNRFMSDYSGQMEEFSRSAVKLRSLDALVDRVFVTIEQNLRPDHLSVLLATGETGNYRFHRSSAEVPRESIRIDSDTAGLVVRFEEVLEREQLLLNPHYKDLRDIGLQFFGSLRCEIVIPIIYEGALIGSINIGARTRRGYRRVEVAFLEQMMAAANVAFSNSMSLKTIEEMNHSMSRFVPMQFLKYLGHKAITAIKLGDHVEKEMTVMFCDIRSFTSLSEKMNPAENFRFLNSYLSRMGPVIREKNGFIDKYIGDAIMALFPDRCEDALSAAIGMFEKLEEYNRHRISSGYPVIRIGMGIHVGNLMLGMIGEEQRIEGTVISDAVNLASRLEGLTKDFGARVLVSKETIDSLNPWHGFSFRYLGRVMVKGRYSEVELYECLDVYPPAQRDALLASREIFEAGVHHHLEENDELAWAEFSHAFELNPQDMAARHYIGRTRNY